MSRPRWAKKLQRQIEDLDECITELADDLEIDLDEAADSRAGGLAALRRTFSPLATGGPAENVGGGPGVEVTGILSGPRGEAAVDGADARAQARGRERAAENREDREAARRRGEVPVETTGILSGPRGESALDRD